MKCYEQPDVVCVYIYIYIYISVCVCVCVCMLWLPCSEAGCDCKIYSHLVDVALAATFTPQTPGCCRVWSAGWKQVLGGGGDSPCNYLRYKMCKMCLVTFKLCRTLKSVSKQCTSQMPDGLNC